MMRKLCGALVVVAMLGAAAVFAWPEVAPATRVDLVPAGKSALARLQERLSAPAHAQQVKAQPARTAVATPPRAAATQGPTAVRQPSPQEQQRMWAERILSRYAQRAERLEQALEAARNAGKTADVAALERALDRERGRVRMLRAQLEQRPMAEAEPAAVPRSTSPYH